MKRTLWIVGGILAAFALAVATVLALDPDPEPPGPIGRELAAPGQWAVRELDLVLVDRSRSTPASAERPASPERILATTIWFPESDGAAGLPLVVYAHGFMGSRSENARLCHHLAGRGFVVAAMDFPRTSSNAPGDPDLADLPQQPGDIHFLIDTLLDRSVDLASPLHGRLDGQRIGLVGLSLGGMTAQLVAFHPRLRDPRIDAVVSIAGPISMFSRPFFAGAALPFLMVAGDVDAIVDYSTNGQAVLERVPQGRLLTLAGGSHVGSTDLAAMLLRWMHNPDSLACDGLKGHTPNEKEGLPPIGAPSDGIILKPDTPLPCRQSPLLRSMRPPRQRMLTRIAVTAFLEARLRDEVDDLPALRAIASEHADVSLALAP